MQHDEKGYEVSGNKQKRELSHRGGRYLTGDPDGDGGAKRSCSNSHDKIRYLEHPPNPKCLAGHKV